MTMEPGLLNDLTGQGQHDWESYVNSTFTAEINRSGTTQFVQPDDKDLENDIIAIDWRGYPTRIRSCLNSDKKTQKFLDWEHNGQPLGRLWGSHEEYVEWRVVKNGAGKITRMEFTTELGEFWRILSRHHPTRTLQLLGEFAGEAKPADPMDVYGVADPDKLTPMDRERAFVGMMYWDNSVGRVRSPYNNGKRAITFMAVGVNTLRAAIRLCAFAAFPFVKSVNGSEVPLTGPEAIPFMKGTALDCRDSDPTIAGSSVNLACERRKFSLYPAPGIYMSSIDSKAVLMPDQTTPVPVEWFTFTRGAKIQSGGSSFSLAQRMVFEPPASAGVTISDLFDEASGNPIEYGAQIAQRLTLSVYARASKVDAVQLPSSVQTPAAPTPCGSHPACASVKNVYKTYEQLSGNTPLFEAADSGGGRG